MPSAGRCWVALVAGSSPWLRVLLAFCATIAACAEAPAQDLSKAWAFSQVEAASQSGDKTQEPKRNGDDKSDNGKDDKDKDKEDETPPWFSAHVQGTVVSQGNWHFRSPYVGPNSFLPILNYRTTETATLYLAARICDGGDIIFDPEIAGGRGLSSTLGIAGFPNGEATRVGVPQPTPYIARLLYRHTLGLGGEQEDTEDGPNEFKGKRDVNRITVRIGKMSAVDIFDDNKYSHDPREQFLNWSLMYNGAWDYPANTRGYTYGMTLEYNTKDFALRYGVFGEPTVANGEDIDPRILQANGHAFEFERRYTWEEHAGKLRFLAYLNNAHMGNYRQALLLMPVNPDITLTRAYRVKYGFGLNWEQELREDLGVFARLGWNDGHTETWAFTEIDATAALGLSLKGACWGRKKDEVGAAFVINGLSNGHRDYLAAGGLGFIIGDGKLSYGEEMIFETYYNWQVRKGIEITLDFQAVENPAYNRDRGPVAILGLRVHMEY